MVSATSKCKDIVLEQFERRVARNSRYSLRSFSRDLGLSPASLSQILAEKQGLSRSLAGRIAAKLGFSPEETERFCDLAQSQYARSQRDREKAKARLAEGAGTISTVQLDLFRILSDWHHFAILELTRLRKFEGTPQWISKSLSINEKTAEAALERLLRAGLLEKRRGKIVASKDFVATPSGIPSEAIKKFHDQILEKAKTALHFQGVQERDFSSVCMAIDHEDLPKAKEWIKEFRRSFCRKLESVPNKNRIYQLSVQFFRLDSEVSNDSI